MAFKQNSGKFSNKEEVFNIPKENTDIVTNHKYKINRPDKRTGVGVSQKEESPKTSSRDVFTEEKREPEQTEPRKNVFRDETDQKDNFIRPVETPGHDKVTPSHDKVIPSETTTRAGGGANIKYEFTDKGTLKAKIDLFKDKDRTDRQGFTDKAALFLENADKATEMVKPEENEAAASNVDQKIEKLFTQEGRKHAETARRYKSIQRESKQEIKQLKKEEKKTEKNHFKESNATFQSENDKFTDPIEKKFGAGEKGGMKLFDSPEGGGMASAKETAEIAVSRNLQDEYLEQKENVSRNRSEKNTQLSVRENESSENKNADKKNQFVENSDTSTKENGGKYTDSQKETNKRFTTNEEKQEQAKARNKQTKKQEKKETKKIALLTSVTVVLRSKRQVQNQLGDMTGTGTGDLVEDGSTGILSAVTGAVKDAYKALIAIPLKALAIYLAPVIAPIILIVCIVAILITMITDVGDSLSGITFTPGEETYETSFTDEEIDAIIEGLYESYPDGMDSSRETVLRFALSQVGGEYCQNHRTGQTAPAGKVCHQPSGVVKTHNGGVSYDCSGFAYVAYKKISVDISNYGSSTAAEEAKKMVRTSKGVSASELLPGDLIFYGGKNNGRYLGIYHVAIYVGNGMDVEAANTSRGVIYRDLPTDKIVYVARPLA